MSSSLANLYMWTDLSVDELAQTYDSEITCILDRMIPVKTIRCIRRRPSHPWFDEECRVAKRCFRHFERAVRRVDPTDINAVAARGGAGFRILGGGPTLGTKARQRGTFFCAY